MTHAIVVEKHGAPSVLKWKTVDVGKPRTGQVQIRHTAIGLNYIDTYQRSGLYPIETPFIPGNEGAGIVEVLGRSVKGLKVGDRVCYAGLVGAYAEQAVFPADRLLKIPDGITDEQAASMMLKGMTAQYLLRQTYRVKKGDTIVIHAAAGGVGLIVCQWAKHLGATVIGTVGSPEKADIARSHGCDHPIIYTKQNFAERVQTITRGAGVPVVYDSVGKDTYEGSLNSLGHRGMLVSFGNASGPVTSINPIELMSKGSLFFTRPSLPHYTGTRKDLQSTARDLFKVVKSGAVKIEINQTYALKDAAKSHRDLESRNTTGSTVLIP